VLAALQERLPWVGVLTQNVDGFHRAAGSRQVVEIHGDIHDLYCTACGWEARVPDYGHLAQLPTCPTCGHIVRPRVVLFDEMLAPHRVAQLGRWQAAPFDVVLSIGTTSAFPYIAGPVLEARRRGATTVEINPGRSEISDHVDLRIEAGARDTLVAVWSALGGSVDDVVFREAR
jgi:NAD-dependent deacetylase